VKTSAPARALERFARLLKPVRRGGGLRLFAISFAALPAAGIVAAPLLLTAGVPLVAGLLYLSYSPICHQNPERSFTLLGHAWAVCHRCSGIYIGFLAGMFVPTGAASILLRHRRAATLAAVAVILADFVSGSGGIAANTPGSRFASGLVFGAVSAVLVYRGISEFLSSPAVPSAAHAFHGEIR
jgi:uncharacterized membrane protein